MFRSPIRRLRGRSLTAAIALTLIGATLTLAPAVQAAPPAPPAPPPGPQGPCDIYAAGGTPCVAAHSTTRALYASYDGPLYQVRRASDNHVRNIGVVSSTGQPSNDAGGYADAAAQDAFCANTTCFITKIYDQSPLHNDLDQAPPGRFLGPAPGGYDTEPIADMAPITINGHKAYGAYIMPGMGFRNNNATGLAINDEPEGIYDVIDGTHYDSGCCFDYGNASTNSRAVGTGTMETTYFGTATAWGSGSGPGPWIMSDQEAGLFSGYNAKQNVADPTIDSWRFVTAMVDGGGGNQWDLRGGNAQQGPLSTFYSGIRPGSLTNSRYYPMHKKGAVLLGTGGDNGNGSSGTFYEGVMTRGYPSQATADAVQANIVAADYATSQITLSPVTAFTPSSTQEITATFTNNTGTPAVGVKLSIDTPKGWQVKAAKPITLTSVAPGASVRTTFTLTSPPTTGDGYLTGKAEWTNPTVDPRQSETTTAKLRNVEPITINEVRFRTSASSTDQFVELYNNSDHDVDLSHWALTNTPSQWSPVTLATIPAGTRLPSHGFYLLGLSGSGLAAPAGANTSTINVRSTTGYAPGQQITIDVGPDAETRAIQTVGTPASGPTTLFVPVSTGPRLTIPAGATNLPVTNATGFAVGQPIGIDNGGHYEQATVTAVGNAATQTTLAAAASAGDTNLKLVADTNITAGDTLTVDTGGRVERVTVTSVGATGSGVDIAVPLKFDHMSGIDVSDPGTGISFTPATRYPHTSGASVQGLGSGITLDQPLDGSHPYGTAVVNPLATTDGYQGSPSPDQWFGGALSTRAGSISLTDQAGVLVDALVYGSQQSSSSGNGTITSPELAVLVANQRAGGCIVVVAGAATSPGRSNARWPDGNNTNGLCHDVITTTTPTPGAPNAQ